MIRQALLLLSFTGMLAAFGCSKDERDPCLQPRTAVLRAHSYRKADTGAAFIDTLLPNAVLTPINADPPIQHYGGQRRVSQFSLTLSGAADSCRWILRPALIFGLQDTITLYYERQLRFLSNACGYTTFFNLTRVSVTTHAMDSAVIINSSVTTDANVEHLKLYF